MGGRGGMRGSGCVRGGGSSGVGVGDGGGESRMGVSWVVGRMGFLRGGFEGCWGLGCFDCCLSVANRVASDAGMFVRKVTYLAFKEGFRIAST